jgi:hypothetical protein
VGPYSGFDAAADLGGFCFGARPEVPEVTRGGRGVSPPPPMAASASRCTWAVKSITAVRCSLGAGQGGELVSGIPFTTKSPSFVDRPSGGTDGRAGVGAFEDPGFAGVGIGG